MKTQKKRNYLKFYELLVHKKGEIQKRINSYLMRGRNIQDEKVNEQLELVEKRRLKMNEAVMQNFYGQSLMQIEMAMKKLQSGIYGTCEYCDNPIPVKRLIASPMVSTCIDCQQDVEVFNRRKLA